MIPLKDDAPCTTTPFVNYFLIGLNLVVFLFQALQPPEALNSFIFQFGLVPAKVTTGIHAGAIGLALVPILTSMFLHGSWWHVIGNMWFLYLFGDNIEDRLGHFLYLIFYLLCGIAAALVHMTFNLGSTVPTVGASGAIAGVMGAYFLLFPQARVLTLVPFFFIYFTWLPAWLMLGYWFILQFLGGAASSIQRGVPSEPIAFWAHVGGFLAGVVLIKLFPASARRYSYSEWE
jgi:rhomboid family protein